MLQSFLRWNVSAMTASTSDQAVAYSLHYGLGVNELVATPIGATVGACIAFYLGRNWAFVNKEGKVSKQAMKFLLMAVTSIGLNTLAVAFYRDVMGIEEFVISRILAAISVGFLWSFPMQRFFVYK